MMQFYPTINIAQRNLINTFFTLQPENYEYFIFQIGFHKCGTTSIWNFMEMNGVHGAHLHGCKFIIDNYVSFPKYYAIGSGMINNHRNNKSILPPECLQHVRFYSDFGTTYPKKNTSLQNWIQLYNGGHTSHYCRDYYIFYELIAKQYPGSKYILNIRPVNHYLRSLYLHHQPGTNNFRFNQFKADLNEYNNNLSDVDVLTMLRKEWYLYNCYLLYYFRNNNIMQDLLIFDVENDSIQKLIDFFGEHHLVLNSKYWKIKNKAKPASYSKEDLLQSQKWNDIEALYPQFKLNNNNNNLTEYQQIVSHCKSERIGIN